MSKFSVLTYRDLADRLGVSLGAAKARVRRAKWSVSMGNDGVAQVKIPNDDLQDMERGSHSVRTHDVATIKPENLPESEWRSGDTNIALQEAFRLLEAERERSSALEVEARNLIARAVAAETLAEAEKRRADKAEASLSAIPLPITDREHVAPTRTVIRSIFRKLVR